MIKIFKTQNYSSINKKAYSGVIFRANNYTYPSFVIQNSGTCTAFELICIDENYVLGNSESLSTSLIDNSSGFSVFPETEAYPKKTGKYIYRVEIDSDNYFSAPFEMIDNTNPEWILESGYIESLNVITTTDTI